jgi:hypothetical protein
MDCSGRVHSSRQANGADLKAPVKYGARLTSQFSITHQFAGIAFHNLILVDANSQQTIKIRRYRINIVHF